MKESPSSNTVSWVIWVIAYADQLLHEKYIITYERLRFGTKERFRSVSLVTYLPLSLTRFLQRYFTNGDWKYEPKSYFPEIKFLAFNIYYFFGQEQQGTEISYLAKSTNDK